MEPGPAKATLRPVSLQLIALLANIGLTCLKFIVGSIAGSRALTADAFNSAGDVVATFVAWLAFRYGKRPPDADHAYGHQNAEALAGLVLGGMLCATGAFICIEGTLGFFEDKVPQAPEALALWAALLTAAVKELLYHASMRVGRRTHSPTLLASARDHRADVVASLVALLGIYLARELDPRADALAGIAIGLYLVYLSYQPLRSNTDILMNAAPPELAKQATALALKVEGIREVDSARVQPIGGRYRMDLIVRVPGELSVTAAHELAHAAEDQILQALPQMQEVHVHVEPWLPPAPLSGS